MRRVALAFLLFAVQAFSTGLPVVGQEARAHPDTGREYRVVGLAIVPRSAAATSVQRRHVAKIKARQDALVKLAQLVQGVEVTPESSRIHALIRGVRFDPTEYHEAPGGGGVEARVVASLPVADGADAHHVAAPVPVARAGAVASDQQHASALVVSATGLSLRRDSGARVLSESGETLYGQVGDVEYVRRHGTVGYAPDESAARGLLRAGADPLIVHALRVENRVNVVVSREDAERIRRADAQAGFLREARVILLDGAGAGSATIEPPPDPVPDQGTW